MRKGETEKVKLMIKGEMRKGKVRKGEMRKGKIYEKRRDKKR